MLLLPPSPADVEHSLSSAARDPPPPGALPGGFMSSPGFLPEYRYGSEHFTLPSCVYTYLFFRPPATAAVSSVMVTFFLVVDECLFLRVVPGPGASRSLRSLKSMLGAAHDFMGSFSTSTYGSTSRASGPCDSIDPPCRRSLTKTLN